MRGARIYLSTHREAQLAASICALLTVIFGRTEMGILDTLLKGKSTSPSSPILGLIANGRNKNSGGHDHRTNSGRDRTPAQRAGDESKKARD